MEGSLNLRIPRPSECDRLVKSIHVSPGDEYCFWVRLPMGYSESLFLHVDGLNWSAGWVKNERLLHASFITGLKRHAVGDRAMLAMTRTSRLGTIFCDVGA